MTGTRFGGIALTGRDIALFEYLSEAKLLERDQIRQLLDFKSLTRVNERLFRLHSTGFLYRYFLGTRAGGRKALYALSPRGAATVGQTKVWKLQRAQDDLLVGEAFIDHQLAVNWCWIWMRCSPALRMGRFIRFSQPISPALPLAPDGYAELYGIDGIQPVFLEVDLGTETARVWDRKIGLYLRLAASGEFQQRFHQQRFKVAVVCFTERRLENLRRTVRKHTSKLFYFALFNNINRDGLHAAQWLRPDGAATQTIA